MAANASYQSSSSACQSPGLSLNAACNARSVSPWLLKPAPLRLPRERDGEREREREGQKHPTQGVEVLIRERLCLLLAREAVSDLNKALAQLITKGTYGHLVYPLPGAVGP